MNVLGEYILRNGLLITTKTERRTTALIRDGIRAARIAGREADLLDCEGLLVLILNDENQLAQEAGLRLGYQFRC